MQLKYDKGLLMTDGRLETDYLIVGSGAMGMAFTDVILTETDAHITIVDEHHKPGGHWNVAYPFVTLHQPSAYYGVSSRELSKGIKDEVGLNKGLNDLASGAEVSAYFDDVMNHQFLPTGRVKYFPMCRYEGDGNFRSKLSGKTTHITAREKIVDCTYLKTSVPATHTPNFTIGDNVNFMPLNDLPTISAPYAGYVVIGGGKTGIDACLWLLENNVPPDDIIWIVSRDAWLLDRQNTQPSEEFFTSSVGAQAAQFEAAAAATSIPDLFDRLEADGVLVRIDKTVRPKMFHGATVSQLELAALRTLKNVVRLGHVIAIEEDRLVLEKGVIPTSQDHVHVDCSASAVSNLASKPIFDGHIITPQTVRSYQPVFSASFIAHIEATRGDEAEKNRLCQVVPLPNHDTDWLRMMVTFMTNQYNWGQDKEIRAWLRDNRLDGFSKLVSEVDKKDTDKMEILARLRNNAFPAVTRLQELLTEAS